MKRILGSCFCVIFIIIFVANLVNINKMKHTDFFLSVKKENSDNFTEKKSNPDLCYQISGNEKYLLFRQNIYKMNETGKLKKIIRNAQNFLVMEDKIIYCTVMDVNGNKICVCDRNGKQTEELCENVDYFTVENDSNLITMISHVQAWTLAQIDLKSKKLNIIDTSFSVSTKYGCFYEDQFIGTGDYTLDTVNIKTGEADRLADFYGKKRAYAQVTSVYVHNEVLYYGLSALKEKDKEYTGLWKLDLSTGKSSKITDGEVWDIDFVGNTCYMNDTHIDI